MVRPQSGKIRGVAATLCVMTMLVGIQAFGPAGSASAATSTPVMGTSRLTPAQIAGWYRSKNKTSQATVSIDDLAAMFVSEGAAEGVAGDIAFAQAMVETGYLTFSTRVPAGNNNFAGLGAVDGGTGSAAFPNARTGVRAQIQHLRAYADPTVTVARLAYPLVDGRFKYVLPKGRAPMWEDFGNGNWASSTTYAPMVLGIHQQMVTWAGVTTPPPPPPTLWKPFSSPEALVAQGHRDLLAREATAAEVSAGRVILSSSAMDPATYLASLVEGEGARHAQPAVRIYLAALGRLPDRNGLHYWTRRHSDGVSLGRLAEQFLDSSEFQRRYGNPSDAGYVDLLYVNVLGRTADPAGADYWVRRLSAGRIDRQMLLIQFSESPEHVRSTLPIVEASIVYLGMLLRAPDPSALSWWSTKKSLETDLGVLIKLVMESSAYQARFAS